MEVPLDEAQQQTVAAALEIARRFGEMRLAVVGELADGHRAALHFRLQHAELDAPALQVDARPRRMQRQGRQPLLAALQPLEQRVRLGRKLRRMLFRLLLLLICRWRSLQQLLWRIVRFGTDVDVALHETVLHDAQQQLVVAQFQLLGAGAAATEVFEVEGVALDLTPQRVQLVRPTVLQTFLHVAQPLA